MAVLPIRIAGEPVLHSPAEKVTDFGEGLQSLLVDLFDTMEAAPGVGLAAPQVGVPLRVFVYDWTDDAKTRWRGVAINPELWISPVPIGQPDEEAESEGCLSVPGERFPLRRSPLAVLRAVDASNVPVEIRADGWLARIFQHEYDHLDGVLYVDRLEYLHARGAAKAIRKNGWGIAGQSWLPGVDELEG